MQARFDYATYKSRERAELALEDMFATGDVFECEGPEIEKRRVLRNGDFVNRYFITLLA